MLRTWKTLRLPQRHYIHHIQPLRQLSSLLTCHNSLLRPTSLPSIARKTSLVQTPRCYSSEPAVQATSFADHDRPELFYHLFHPPTSVSDSSPVFAVSFVSETPRGVDSCSVIGWLPALETEEAGLNDFKENPKFRDVLHEAIQSGLRDGVDDIQANGAVQTQQGWMHIHDERNVPALGRIGDPDDIIASVRVEDGKILHETYQPMPSYRLCTADGVLKLTEGLFVRLKAVLAERVRSE